MKRISLFLLTFALTGGTVFAQLGFSGKLNLGTKINLMKGQDNYDNKYVKKDETVSSSFNEFSYGDGPFTLTFGLGFNEDPDTNDDVYIWNYMGARYANEDYGFSMGFTHHLEGGMDVMKVIQNNTTDDSQKMVFEFWETYGWYNFLGGDLELRVAKKGGQPEWWRAASVVLDAYEAWDDGGLFGDGSQAFEANEDGGIWLNYTGIRDLAFGVRLRDPFGEIGFGNANKEFNNTPGNYFKDMTVGAKYDTGDWGVSFMANLRGNKAYDYWATGNNLWDAFTGDLHAGFNYKILDGIWVYGDFTAYEFGNFGVDDWWIGEPVFNFGLGSSYEGGPINASLTFMALDLSSAVGKTKVREGEWAKEDSMEMDLFISGFYDRGSLSAGVEVNVYDLVDNFFEVGQLYTTQDWGGGRSLHINPSVGYQIASKFRADLGLGWTKGIGSENDKYQLFRVNPAFTFIPAGNPDTNIVLSYYFEYDTDTQEFTDHYIGLGFTWSF
jgi:hypothetical protein